ncbi:MAG TPA: hypothetical protein DC047_09955 [Blastocatellia bacterium]|nr:hypothetical protein [Blastocatellia bacterium]
MANAERKLANVCIIFFIVAATLHIRQLLIEWRFLRRATESGFLTSPFFAELRVFFIASFLLCAIGLLIKRRFGLVLSVFGLAAVLLGYLGWRLYSARQLRVASQDYFFTQHPEFVPSHASGLIGARWWDLLTLGCCFVLLIWEVTLLTKRSQRK